MSVSKKTILRIEANTKIEKRKWELVNLEGCLMDSIVSSSYKKAREYFNANYSGKYKIISELGTNNVILK